MSRALFSGPDSLRHPRERVALVLTAIFALPIASILGVFVHERIGLPEVALFIVVAMLYVTLARGRLIGSSVMIHEAQYPRVFSIVQRACAALEIPMPLIFVREDYHVPVVALGFGEPYALVLSSHWVEFFQDDELAFAVGRELGHIAAGHTRFHSLLSVNGNENPLIALIFGGWLRTCALTCDKVGLLVCGSLDAASRSIAISSFHHFGRHVDVTQFAEQGREIARDSVLRMGEWLGAEPYATRRIAEMERFMRSTQYARAEEWFLREREAPPQLATATEAHVTKGDCAGIARRAWAVAIDAIVVLALIFALGDAGMSAKTADDTTPATSATTHADQSRKVIDMRAGFIHFPLVFDNNGMHIEGTSISDWALSTFLSSYVGMGTFLSLYLFLLVGLTGQSFGMMIAGLRVVSTDFRAAGFWRSLVRYFLVWIGWPFLVACTPFMRRIMPHDLLSGTRLIRAERMLARASSTIGPDAMVSAPS